MTGTVSKQNHVEIVILNFKGINDTITLLENLRQIEYENYGIIVIENGSGDDSTARLKEIENRFPSCEFIYNQENRGFAGGCNQGIEIALRKDADFVLLLNNDTTVEYDFLKPLVELSKKRNCLTGGLIYFPTNRGLRIWSFGGKLTWGAVPGHLDFFKKNPVLIPAILKTDFIPGCCLLIPKEAIEKVGLLDEDYFAYIEDVDYCVRANKAGFPSYVISLSIINHNVGTATGGGYSPAGRFLIAESSVVFMRKHANSSQILKFKTLFWIGIIVASIREGSRGNLIAVKEKIRGYRSGWRKKLKTT